MSGGASHQRYICRILFMQRARVVLEVDHALFLSILFSQPGRAYLGTDDGMARSVTYAPLFFLSLLNLLHVRLAL
jgi:hypothetical protein